jgi:hypothetical protein
MSHAYSTSTYIVARDTPLPASAEQMKNLWKATIDGASPPRRVTGSSRNGWAIYMLGHLLDRVDLPALGCLRLQHEDASFEDEHGRSSVSILRDGRLAAAADAMANLLAALRAEPSIVYDAEFAGIFSDDDVEVALARDYISEQPAFDYGNVRGDEGESADYLMVWLRSIAAVMGSARQQGLAVAHEIEY